MTEYKYNVMVNDEIFAKECRLPIALMIVETFAVKFYAEPNLNIALQRIHEEESVENTDISE